MPVITNSLLAMIFTPFLTIDNLVRLSANILTVLKLFLSLDKQKVIDILALWNRVINDLNVIWQYSLQGFCGKPASLIVI